MEADLRNILYISKMKTKLRSGSKLVDVCCLMCGSSVPELVIENGSTAVPLGRG